ncbi:MAG: cation acetate symporter [Planctomycetota bacterium]|nr:MAG: cation acetate symporter [Planctomycetota bacterium]
MLHAPSTLAIVVFLAMVGVTLGISVYLGRKAKSSAGYFAAHGQIPWLVNGVAFAGDYLSAASFLGICGMIAFYGYDGFLYSIGYLAGWVVALFVVAEPMKRLGKFTFADALNARFNSRGIKLAAGVSTLAVSVFYLIPQMVGAGALVQPLLGLPHWLGVVIVGTVVILIVVTAGMVSTTWVQFIKGALLVVFSTILTAMILERGFEVRRWREGHDFVSIGPARLSTLATDLAHESQLGYPEVLPAEGPWKGLPYVRLRNDGVVSVWRLREVEDVHNNYGGESIVMIDQTQTVTKTADGEMLINGKSADRGAIEPVGFISELPNDQKKTGPLGPLEFLSILQDSEVVLWANQKVVEEDGSVTTVYYPKPTPGSEILQPGASATFAGIRSEKFSDKLNFLSLMLALFCGTASLPHILIRYYTVKDEASARKSTIVGIACIGFFYILTLYMGLGAMTSGALDPTDSNMAAPLLARSISEWLFAIISAIAFTTVLGTVSGLILASSGAVTHDLLENLTTARFTDHQRVRIAKMASVVVGVVAIALGILFKELNVSYLVGWAFSVAASANLPALVMLLFWRGTTRQGIIAAVIVGMVSSLAWILLSGDTFASVYGLPKESSPMPFSQPGIVTIPLGFATLIAVSLVSRRRWAPGA